MDFRPHTDTYTTFSAPIVNQEHGLLEDSSLLSQGQCQRRLQDQAPKWQLQQGRLRCTFPFDEVSACQGFTHRVQALSHARNQHPHIFVGFKNVQIELWTQGKGGLTAQDFDLAELIDQALDMP